MSKISNKPDSSGTGEGVGFCCPICGTDFRKGEPCDHTIVLRYDRPHECRDENGNVVMTEEPIKFLDRMKLMGLVHSWNEKNDYLPGEPHQESKELLRHFSCARCHKWWSIGDSEEIPTHLFCPWCGTHAKHEEKTDE